MKALSVMQPWAWLLVKGLKDVENRSWATKYRGPLLIHASQKFDWEGLEFIDTINPGLRWQIWQNFGIRRERNRYRFRSGAGKFGGIVGKIDLVDCVNKSGSPWFCGPYGFIVDKAEVLPFQPCRGYQRFFNVELDIQVA